MPRIRISASFPAELILRQTPGRSGRWQEFELLARPDGDPVDAWVVYDDLKQPEQQLCPAANTLLITGEPESLRRYRSRYTAQFGQVWTSHRTIRHRHLTRSNEGQHWHYGLYPGAVHSSRLGFDELVDMPRPDKSKQLSVICSTKAHTADQRQRLEFVQRLQAAFGNDIDVFGRGTREVADKSEAIFDYRYHVVLENDHSEHFMTEKLADAFLGWSYPIYFGSSEACHRYPEGSFTAIDIYQPDEAIRIIRNLLTAHTYQQSLPAIAEARHRVLFQNNFCNMLAEYWRQHLVCEPASHVRLLPKNYRASLVLQQFTRALRREHRRTQRAA